MGRTCKVKTKGISNKFFFISEMSLKWNLKLFRSGSCCGSRFELFYHQAKNKKHKTFIPNVLGLFCNFLSLKTDVNVPSKSDKQKNFYLVVTVLSSHGSVVAEMQVGQHGIHLVSPDRLRHHGVPAVHLVLPQHLSPWKWGVATMEQQGLGASKNKHKPKPNCE
jgi:hypothetical protein